MATTITVPIEGFAFLNNKAQGANDHTSSPVRITLSGDYLLVKFKTPTDGSEFKRIILDDTAVHIYVADTYGASDAYYDEYKKLYADIVTGDFDVETVTYSTRPEILYSSLYAEYNMKGLPHWVSNKTIVTIGRLKHGIAWRVKGTSPLWVEIATKGSYAPYVSVALDDSYVCPIEIESVSPDSGAVIKTTENVFSWGLADPGKCLADLVQSSAVFRWRTGTSGTIHTISVSGNTQSVTVPANTFADTTSIQWQVAVTANSGVTTTSDWVTLSTADATPTAAPLNPVNTVIDSSGDTLFQWQHTISTGTAQSKAELQKSEDGSTWSALATVTGSARQWTCPAGTLTSSIKYWRVRTYNADGVASEWSEAAQIVVIAAPSTPAIQIKSTGPRPSISWQTSEQEAYQVELDGALSGGTHYGAEKSWTSPAYLADGSHTVRVRVQNQYGMWSDWGAAALPVTNTPGAAIALNVEASSVAELSWQTTGSYDFYLVYRDGKPIAKLEQTQYTDELSSGSASYQVRGCYDDSGNYGISKTVSVQVLADVHMMSDLDTGETLRLPYSDSQHRQTTRTLSRQVELLQLSGAYYPVAVEVDSGTDALSITAALTDDEQVRKLMSLVGKLVCAKTPQGDMVIGYITSLPKQHDGFLNVFSFTVERIDYDDEVTL